MKKAMLLSIAVTTAFYMLCGCVGYSAFGDSAPGNLLTGFGFFEPFWLLDIANIAVVVHLVVAYQVSCQPLYSFLEKWAAEAWPDSKLISTEIKLPLVLGSRSFKLKFFRLVWRTAFVIVITVLSVLLPFFNGVVGLLGAIEFWPLTVYFPVEMYMVQKKIPRWSNKWMGFQLLSLTCLVVLIAAAAGSVARVLQDLKDYKPFKSSA